MLNIEYVKTSELKPYANNAKLHPAEQVEQIKRSIEEFGFNDPIAVWRDNEIIEGHGRLIASMELGIEEVPVIRLDDLTDEERRAYALVHNKLTMNSDFDDGLLDIELGDIDIDMEQFGFDIGDIGQDNVSDEVEHFTLSETFIVPPFSILDTRQGYWQTRKKAWKGIGIKSEVGRSENITNATDVDKTIYSTGCNGMAVQTSIFDPVLTEIMYRWFNVDGGTIYDCFAGGSVRGVVAEMLGYKYIGIDLRQEQIDANVEQAQDIGVSPTWVCDDSLNADKYIEDETADMIFTCPPYADLEVYSDDPRDISNMGIDDFKKVYREILKIACNKLKQNRFAIVVVGDVRGKDGAYINLIDYTKGCLLQNGLKTYNEFILIEQSGTGAIRAKKQFEGWRKAIKTHQNVLVFYKGNPRNINNEFEKITIDDSAFDDVEG